MESGLVIMGAMNQTTASPHSLTLPPMPKIPIVCLMGPTATGKTALAVALAQALDGEVVSVDSALVYRGMDIGTAKPDWAERDGVPHHLIDIIEPNQTYSAADFRRDALALIGDVHARGRVPILAGGTMLYFRALLDGMAEMPESDPAARAGLEAELAQRGAQALHQELQQVDSHAAERIHLNDPQRLLRALEVYRSSGVPLSEWHVRAQQSAYAGPVLKLGLIPEDRPRHRALVASRFMAMIEAGFADEVQALYRRGDLRLDMPSVRCVGYRQLWQYFNGDWDWDLAVEKAITATRQLAKRQMTWLRKESDLTAWNAFELNRAESVDFVRDWCAKSK
ncbi:tRNA delta(2)-isopentenylpyrophosphate transferase [gamma proteobacterium HTCC5015]|nr:tRNA delta(2)-isopentenylpyrophosphate transferase [gamma proteobacterium HTCC5015]